MYNRSLLLGMALILGEGCVRSSPSLDSSLSLGPSFEWETSRAFQRALQSEPGSNALEQARIDYLLERVSKSPYNFLRNGSRYTGKQAESHFRWKYFFNRGRVKRAEDFIDQVATRSKRSGQPYWVDLPDKRRFSLRVLLMRELNSFDQALEEKRNRAEVLEKTH